MDIRLGQKHGVSKAGSFIEKQRVSPIFRPPGLLRLMIASSLSKKSQGHTRDRLKLCTADKQIDPLVQSLPERRSRGESRYRERESRPRAGRRQRDYRLTARRLRDSRDFENWLRPECQAGCCLQLPMTRIKKANRMATKTPNIS
jgi:hypothetical protein